MKEKTTLPYLVRLFKDNELFRQNYIEKIDTTIKSKPFRRSHVFKGWKLIDDDTKDNDIYNNIINNTNDNIATNNTTIRSN